MVNRVVKSRYLAIYRVNAIRDNVYSAVTLFDFTFNEVELVELSSGFFGVKFNLSISLFDVCFVSRLIASNIIFRTVTICLF